ncbi:MAG: BolA/IbaG family iron-sulfur metabolism protein [Steroidobacteraceae bacterium]
MNPNEIEELIRGGLSAELIQVQSDDNTHYSAVVVSQAFAGLRGVARHQLIYKTLGARMGREIHALSIQAHTPAEWAALQTSDSRS